MPGFANPAMLGALLVLPACGLLYYAMLKKRKKAAIEFSRVSYVKAARGDAAVYRRPHILFLLSVMALGLLVVALADPTIPLERSQEGVNVVLAIDVSGSMSATDYSPTRLGAAKNAAALLIGQLGKQDYAGVVVFEDGATSAAYLSPDTGRVLRKLSAIEPGTGKTALGDGLLLGIDMADSIPNRKKAVVLLSDGVSNAGSIPPLKAAGYAKEYGIQVFTVGLGSKEGGVAGYDAFGDPQYAGLDEATLEAIAQETGGRYFRSVDEGTLAAIYAGLNAEIRTETVETSVKDAYIAAAGVLLLAGLVLRYGGRRMLP